MGKGERISNKVKTSLGVQVGENAVVVQEKDAGVRCPACGDRRINVQIDHATCLNCGSSQDTDEFIDGHIVYIKVVPDDNLVISRRDIRFRMQCPSCGSRNFDILFTAGRCRCNQCLNEQEVRSFIREKGHEHPIPAGADRDDSDI